MLGQGFSRSPIRLLRLRISFSHLLEVVPIKRVRVSRLAPERLAHALVLIILLRADHFRKVLRVVIFRIDEVIVIAWL